MRSRKWLRPIPSLVISLIPLWFPQLKTLLGVDLINFRIFFLKALKLLTSRMLWSRLFHLITGEGKKNIWKSFVLFWKGVCFQHFYWCKRIVLKELIWKDTEEIHVCKICKLAQLCKTSDGVEGTLDLAHHKAFLLNYLLLHLWLLGMRYIGQILFLVKGWIINFYIYNVTIIKMRPDKSFVYSKKCGSWNETSKFT